MASLLVKRDTMTDQVVRHLENAILTGELKPCSRVKSVRELAAIFGVSFRVISIALDRLEDKKLIVRKNRSGVYVSDMASNPNVTEVLIFVFGDNPERSPFVRLISDVVTSRAAAGNFDFFARFVTMPYDQLNRHDYLLRRLDAEVARLSKQFHPEVAIVVGFRFGRDDIRKCLELPFPLLFIGDFAEGDFTDLNYNRLGTTHDFFSEPLQWARERHLKKVALFTAQDLERGKYLEHAVAMFEQEARHCGIETAVIQVNDTRDVDEAKRRAGLEQAAASFAAFGGAGLMILDHIMEIEYLMARLRDRGFSPLSPQLEVIGCERNETVPGMKYLQLKPDSVTAFHGHICRLLERIKAGKLSGYREQYQFTKEIV